MRKVEFEVNFSVKLYASLTREDLAYLQITCPYVYYLKYTELKKSLDSQTGVLPSNPAGSVYDWTRTSHSLRGAL